MAFIACTEKELLDNTVQSLRENLIKGEVIIALDEEGPQNVFKYFPSDCTLYAFELRNHGKKLRAIVSDVFHLSPIAPGRFDFLVRTLLEQYTDFVIDHFENVVFDFESESEGYVRHIVMM